MLRFEAESSSLKTYVPAGKTFPGTSTGALKVTIVFLSNSLPEAGGTNPILMTAAHDNAIAIAPNRQTLELMLNMVKPPSFGCSRNSTANVSALMQLPCQFIRSGLFVSHQRIDKS